MKTITAEQLQVLEDLAAQGLLGRLPLQMVEKDIHITDMLEALSRLQVRHGYFQRLMRGESTRVDDGITLVFAGGTCLSKAHRFVSRMSEDVDIKVILAAPSTELKANTGHRARLKALHQALADMLDELGLVVPDMQDSRANPSFCRRLASLLRGRFLIRARHAHTWHASSDAQVGSHPPPSQVAGLCQAVRIYV